MTSENFSPWNSKMLFKEKVAGQIQNKYQEQKIKFEYSYNSFNYIDYIFLYYINTSEIPSELSCENFISSHVKITCYLHTWRDHRHYGYIIKCAFFSGVYIINRILHARLWIWILSYRVQLDILLIRCSHSWDIELDTQR